MTLFLVYLFSSALFLLLMISLGFQPRFLNRITGALLLLAGVGGTILYGYGFVSLFDDLLQAVMRTLFSVFCMFLGRNEISTISAVPALATPGMQSLLYAIHLLALFCTASAVIAAMGTRLLRTLHLLLLRRGELHVIFGAGEDTVAFGRELMKKRARVVVFVDKSGALDERILRSGSLLFSDGDALTPGASFLRRLGMRRAHRRLCLYCLNADPGENLRYAAAMAEALRKEGIPAGNTALTILLEEEKQGETFQAGEERCGFGSVLAIPRRDLAARLMIQAAPPWENMRFDENGRAAEDFEALVVGFGLTGQAVLRSLVMNAQFAGSRFRAVVVDRDPEERSGDFSLRSPALRDSYEIRFLKGSAQSAEVYRHLESCAGNLNYVVICAGSDKENEEIAAAYARLLARLDCRAPLLLCTPDSVRRFHPDSAAETYSLYRTEILCSQRLDARAMLLNHQYHAAEGRTAEEDWARCDYFSRLSCRASADFLPAFLRAAGVSAREAAGEGFVFPPAVLENLSETEHLRWCAFHRVMGYRSMPEALFRQRAEVFRHAAETGASAPKPGKDTVRRLHACLVSWEELDGLSALEQELTGRTVDYKELDRDNVRMIPDMLRLEAGHE